MRSEILAGFVACFWQFAFIGRWHDRHGLRLRGDDRPGRMRYRCQSRRIDSLRSAKNRSNLASTCVVGAGSDRRSSICFKPTNPKPGQPVGLGARSKKAIPQPATQNPSVRGYDAHSPPAPARPARHGKRGHGIRHPAISHFEDQGSFESGWT
jgi:hypothetical protein